MPDRPSEAYRVARRRADGAWRLLSGAGLGVALSALLGLIAGRRLPRCVWWFFAHPSRVAAMDWFRCWGWRTALGLCAATALPTVGALAWHWRCTHRSPLLRRPGVPAGGTAVERAAAAAGLSADQVQVVPDSQPWALTHGLLRPRVRLSSALVACLKADELAAVLAHERHHLLRRDPLRLWAARAARMALLAVPPARALLEAWTVHSELAADAFAMDRVGTRPLAAALQALLTGLTPQGRDRVFGLSWAGLPSRQALLRLRVAQVMTFPEPLRLLPLQAGPVALLLLALGGAAVWLALALCASALLRSGA